MRSEGRVESAETTQHKSMLASVCVCARAITNMYMHRCVRVCVKVVCMCLIFVRLCILNACMLVL